MNGLLFPASPISAVPVTVERSACRLTDILVGRNYEAHAREMGVAVDRDAPFYFTKSAAHYVP